MGLRSLALSLATRADRPITNTQLVIVRSVSTSAVGQVETFAGDACHVRSWG